MHISVFQDDYSLIFECAYAASVSEFFSYDHKFGLTFWYFPEVVEFVTLCSPQRVSLSIDPAIDDENLFSFLADSLNSHFPLIPVERKK